MSCAISGNISICRSDVTQQSRGYWVCLRGEKDEGGRKHRRVIHFFERYDPTLHCSCGDTYHAGLDAWELAPRPFERGWRPVAQERFRKLWNEAAP